MTICVISITIELKIDLIFVKESAGKVISRLNDIFHETHLKG